MSEAFAPAAAPGKPLRTLAGLGNLSFGFFGIQAAFALQNANMSRIFQSFGESLDGLAVLWIAAPLTGLLVQPVIGHYSDRTWTRFGRRRPYFIAGAALATLALIAMPNAHALAMAAALLWLLDGSINVSMEPFRAFVGDMLDERQHAAGYAVQTAFVGAGAVLGSLTPFLLDRFGIANAATGGGVPDTVRYSFYLGAAVLAGSVLWTVLTTREYSPDQQARFAGSTTAAYRSRPAPHIAATGAVRWIAGGLVVLALVAAAKLDKELYLLGALVIAYGAARLRAARAQAAGRDDALLVTLVSDAAGMPPVMKRLALVQFFTWSALFIMWIYTAPVVAQYAFGSADPASAAYNRGANWAGVLFAAYNAAAAVVAAFVLGPAARRFGKGRLHALALAIGAAGLASFLVIRDPTVLLASEVGIGVAWASILAMPYAILASSLPQAKLGTYMGIFNVFIVVPQLLVATVIGAVVRHLFPHDPIWTMGIAAIVMLLAAVTMLRVSAEDAAA